MQRRTFLLFTGSDHSTPAIKLRHMANSTDIYIEGRVAPPPQASSFSNPSACNAPFEAAYGATIKGNVALLLVNILEPICEIAATTQAYKIYCMSAAHVVQGGNRLYGTSSVDALAILNQGQGSQSIGEHPAQPGHQLVRPAARGDLRLADAFAAAPAVSWSSPRIQTATAADD